MPRGRRQPTEVNAGEQPIEKKSNPSRLPQFVQNIAASQVVQRSGQLLRRFGPAAGTFAATAAGLWYFDGVTPAVNAVGQLTSMIPTDSLFTQYGMLLGESLLGTIGLRGMWWTGQRVRQAGQLEAELASLKLAKNAEGVNLTDSANKLAASNVELQKQIEALEKEKAELQKDKSALEQQIARSEIAKQRAKTRADNAKARQQEALNKRLADLEAQEEALNQREAALEAEAARLNEQKRAQEDMQVDLERWEAELDAAAQGASNDAQEEDLSSSESSSHSSGHDAQAELPVAPQPQQAEEEKAPGAAIVTSFAKQRSASPSIREQARPELEIPPAQEVPRSPPRTPSPTRH